MSEFKFLDTCLACGGSNDLKPFLDLGKQPLANEILKQPDSDQDRFPLKVNYCGYCTHNQLSISVSPERMFRDYKYVSGTTDTLKKVFAEIADTYSEMLDSDSRILDIGCNDGTLLEEFTKIFGEHFVVFGVDPADAMDKILTDKKLPHVKMYWDKNSNMAMNFDLITAFNVLAHNEDPKGFLRACRNNLAPHGKVLVMFPYNLNVIKENQFDQFYHEHINYFNIRSFTTMLAGTGLSLVGYEFYPIHGGSIMFELEETAADLVRNKFNLEPEDYNVVYSQKEMDFGLYDFATYEAFAERVKNNVYKFSNILKAPLHGKVIGYAASAKAAVVLNYLNNIGDGAKIDAIVDDNPLKWGYYLPGTTIPIKSPAELIDSTMNRLVPIFAHNFKNEIRARLINCSHTYVDYVPEVREYKDV